LSFIPPIKNCFFGGTLEGELLIYSLQKEELEDLSLKHASTWLGNQESGSLNSKGEALILFE